MIGAYASLAVVVLASVLAGRAVLALCGRRELSWQAPAMGLAALLALAGIAVRLPGEAAAVAIALCAAIAASALALLASARAAHAPRAPDPHETPPVADKLPALQQKGLPLGGWGAAGLAVVVASLPFIAAGRVGILGQGLVNDDMASHLLMAAWLEEGFSPVPVLIEQGYPVGPHALVAGLSWLLGADRIEVFAGLTLAIPALTALLAFGALSSLRPAVRTLAAAATALPYLVAAYLAQEAFKEPIMALFLLASALWLPHVARGRDAVPLGVLAAGTVYVYSFPGLVWLAGAAAVWAAIEVARCPELRARLAGTAGRALVPLAIASGVALLLVAPDIDRIRDFTDFRALDPDRANEGGLGNLRGHLSPLEALGIWPTSEFRLSAGAGSLPAAVFYAGAALGAAAFAFGLPGWIRRHGTAIPAALAAALVVYIGARTLGTVYTSAKALAVAAPLITLIAIGGLLGGYRRDGAADGPEKLVRGRRRMRRRRRGRFSGTAAAPALATAFLIGAGLSSFLVLRQAPVGPPDHMEELAQIRPHVEGQDVLFLGRDNFVLYSLRGSKPFTHVRNYYDPYFVEPNFELREVGSKFDFDSVEGETLARFPYVITTRAAYASGPPPEYAALEVTDSYILWERGGSSEGREPVETGPEPAGTLDCTPRPTGEAAVMRGSPVVVPAGEWSPPATLESSGTAELEVDLPPGRWEVSIAYDSTRSVTLAGPGISEELPGNLDYRGTGPFWAAGTLEVGEGDGGPVVLAAEVDDPPAAGRLLGAKSVAHLGPVAFSPAGGGYVSGVSRPHPGSSATLERARSACGEETDWSDVR